MTKQSPALPAPGAARVLVVGDLILDEYVRGSVSRISPEAPVPVLESAAREQALGGAANVGRNLAALGCQVLMCGAVGDDEAGADLLARMVEAGLDVRGVARAAQRPTTHKLRVVAQVQHLLRIDREVKAPLDGASVAFLLGFIRSQISEVHGIICSDYNKGLLTADVLREILDLARAAHVPVAVDPKGRTFRPYRGATYLTPNLHEMELACGTPIDSPAAMDAAAAAVHEQTGVQGLLITCGKDGMVLYPAGRPKVIIPAEAREVYDVTGAGDTVIATLALAAFQGADLDTAARLANTAAGIVVGKLGTAAVSRAELMAACERQAGTGDAKLVPADAAAALGQAIRQRGQRLVFTNGCFDLLHAGHVQYLQAAKAMGDVLVVGLNSDASVRGLKGPSRPLVPQAERAFVLSALACVDAVVLFDTPTPAELVDALQPDILVKGADYRDKEVVGRHVVEARGGRVELVPLTEGRSTSNLVQTILERHSGSASAAS